MDTKKFHKKNSYMPITTLRQQLFNEKFCVKMDAHRFIHEDENDTICVYIV
jgi:hypothetical protein